MQSLSMALAQDNQNDGLEIMASCGIFGIAVMESPDEGVGPLKQPLALSRSHRICSHSIDVRPATHLTAFVELSCPTNPTLGC